MCSACERLHLFYKKLSSLQGGWAAFPNIFHRFKIEDDSSALGETFCIKKVSLAKGNTQGKHCEVRHSYFIGFPIFFYELVVVLGSWK